MSVASQPTPTTVASPAKGPASAGNEIFAHPFLNSSGWRAPKEGELQPDVKDEPDRHRPDYGQRDVAPRIAGLPSQLDGLFEALVGKDYTPDAKGAKNARDPERGEATLGGKVGGIEGHDYQHGDGEEGDRDLPYHDRVVGLRKAPHTQEIYDGEYTHEGHGKDDTKRRQDLRASLADHSSKGTIESGTWLRPGPRSAPP